MTPGADRSWIDKNLVSLGVAFLVLGLLLTIADSVRGSLSITFVAQGDPSSISLAGLAINIMSALAGPLVYNSVIMIAAGILLRNWRVTLVGFENTTETDLLLREPDEDNTVWIGKTYPNAFDAELAAAALAKRLARAD